MPVETALEMKAGAQANGLFDKHNAQGLSEFKQSKFAEAVASFQQALEIRRDAGVVHNLGVAFARLEKLDDAAACFREALELSPGSLISHKNLGLALFQNGKLDEALVHYTEAARLDAKSAAAQHDLGRLLFQAGRFEEAITSFREALKLDPLFWTAHYELGRCLVKLGKKDDAIACYDDALQVKPDAADVHNNLGILLEQSRKYQEAVQSFRRALRFNPNSTETHSNLGVALAGLGKLEEAVGSYREALRIAPNSAEAHNNLGNALRTLGRLEESRTHLEEAIRLMPAYAEAHNNLAITHLQLGDPAQAVVFYDRALELKPEYPEARLNRALALLAQGDMEQGWREYEWRWHGNGLKKRSFPQPEWTGEPLPEGSVLLWTEQGMGDTFQFIRYAHLVKERVGSVILEAHPNILAVLKSCPGICQLVPQGKPLPEFSAHCPLLSLPRIFQSKLSTIPAPIPYLAPEPERVKRWQDVLDTIPGFKIGIAWQGNREFRGDRQRSLALRNFAALAALPGVSLISLQKGEGSQQVEELARKFVVHTLSGLDEQGGAFLDTAAVMSRLDLVVTSDTAIAHLAGALGVPVWVILSAVADWRWLRERDDSPWYPSMRLFRQKEVGNWGEVLQRVAAAAAVKKAEGERTGEQTPAVGSPGPAGSSAGVNIDAIYQRGLEHLKQARWALGEPFLREVLRLQPEHAAAQHNLGVALAKLGRWNDAAGVFEELLKKKPDMAEAYNNLGLAYLDGGKPDKAEAAFRAAVGLKRDSWDFQNNLGVALCRQDRLEDAAAAYRQALILRPKHADAHANLGHVLRLLGRLDEAHHHCELACQLRPDSPEAHNNHGLVHRDLGNLEAALESYQKALAINPDHPEVRLNRALIWLSQGDFARGWPEYEWRWRVPGKQARSFAVPHWDGYPLSGRRILIHTEQGLGDTLQFIRYAPLIQQRGGRVVVETSRELIALLSDCPGIDQLIVRGSPLPEVAAHCPLLSLPLVLQTRIDNIPAQVPYVIAHPRRIAKWKSRLESLTGFKIGIAWQGNPEHAADRQRSLSLEHFSVIARSPEAKLVSLQKGRGADQAPQLRTFVPLHELPGLDEDGNAFMDTAAVMMLLDLVVTSDTAVAHLAGALGVPVWGVLPCAADWRWLRGRNDSPWYPSMRLFRQEQPGDWAGVFQRVAEALRERRAGTAPVRAARAVTGTAPSQAPKAAVSTSPRAEELYQRALQMITQDKCAEGEACLREVLTLQPERWGAHLNLGVALARQKKLPEAIACFERYLMAMPQSLEGHNNLGLAHLELNQLPEAEKAFFSAARLQPENADYQNNLGVCLVRQNKHDEAIAAFQKALAAAPEKLSTLINLANAFKNKKELAKAVECYKAATRIRPKDPEMFCALGKAYSELGDRAQSAVCYRQAVELDPKSADAHNNLAVALADLNQVKEAEFHLKEAVKLRPEHGETHRNLGIIQLMGGNFEQGWAEYEWRWRCNFPDPHAKTCPRWDGKPLAGRTILLYSEQGLGDAIQFIRYAPLVQRAGGKVVFECPKVLASVFKSVPGIDHLIPQGAALPKVDVAAPLLSLPFLLGTTVETVPATVPYIHADADCLARWRQALRHLGGFKVAIAWQGSPKYAGDRQRSVPLKHFAPVAAIPGVQLLSLQKGFGTEQLGSTAREVMPLDLGRQIDEGGEAFVDSAAVMKLADLVITSDTALAHLAGAMGVPVWLVLHFAGDWRWLRDRDDSPWYASMRLFRQQTWGDWSGVFERVAAALHERLTEDGQPAAMPPAPVTPIVPQAGDQKPEPVCQTALVGFHVQQAPAADRKAALLDRVFGAEGNSLALVERQAVLDALFADWELWPAEGKGRLREATPVERP